jgi:uncharacterized membrane protein (UPF0127 family)
METRAALLHSATGSHRLRLCLARFWWQRLRGLMFAPRLPAPWRTGASHAPTCGGLLLMPCQSVHGFGLREALDIAYLGPCPQAGGPAGPNVPRWRVIRVAQLSPWAVSAEWGSQHTLELPDGAIDFMGLRAGDVLELLHD